MTSDGDGHDADEFDADGHDANEFDASGESIADGNPHGEDSGGNPHVEDSVVTTPGWRGAAPWWIETYVLGFAMGTADAVPGVSGGTIALISGIYDRLVTAFASVDPPGLLVALKRFDLDSLREQFVEMDAGFLIALGLGMVTGIATMARVLELALDVYTAITFAFFFGLIGASAVILYDQVSLSTRRQQVAAVVGVLSAFLLVGEFRAGLGHELYVIFGVAVVSISAMLLPGVSGSLLLLMFGQLEYLAAQLNDLIDGVAGLATGGSIDSIFGPATVVFTYGAGAVVGLLTIARIVRWALERDRVTTLTFLVSLMVGALRLPIAEVLDALYPELAVLTAAVGPLSLPVGVAPGAVTPSPLDLLVVAVSAAAGALLIYGLDRYTGGIGYV